MQGSDRLRRVGPLLRLCRTTYVQFNAGFRSGCRPRKPAWVHNSASDLVHAYMQACVFATTKGHVGHVLILEDDAEFMPEAAPFDFSQIDTFLSTTRHWDAYTFGSFGGRMPTTKPHVRMNSGRRGAVAFTQAVVWSRRARHRLLVTPGHQIPHIDGHFLSMLQYVYAFRRPLVVQRFPVTENSGEWCVMCTPGRWARHVDDVLMGSFRRILQILEMDRSVWGWHVIYTYHMVSPLLVVILATVAIAALRVKSIG